MVTVSTSLSRRPPAKGEVIREGDRRIRGGRCKQLSKGLELEEGTWWYYFINSTKGSERRSVCMRANAETGVKKVERLRQAKATSLRKLRLAMSKV